MVKKNDKIGRQHASGVLKKAFDECHKPVYTGGIVDKDKAKPIIDGDPSSVPNAAECVSGGCIVQESEHVHSNCAQARR